MRLAIIAALVAGCGTDDPRSGTATLSGLSGEQYAWASRSDLGWFVHLEPGADTGNPITCSEERGSQGASGFSFTQAALAATGDVPIIDTSQVATDPSATLTLGVTVYAPGTVTLTRVSGSIAGDFTATSSDGTFQLTGSLIGVPYCP